MRSMKFKIIFVTTCLALNIDGLLADPALLFDIKFDTVEGQETYLKSQGIHNMEAFDPVRSFMGISMKPSVSSALPHFSEGTTPSDWMMVKMASDKKYIELAPGTEIYIKNNVSYEFKGIDELVVSNKLPVNEQKPAGVQAPKVESAVGTGAENKSINDNVVKIIPTDKVDVNEEKKIDESDVKKVLNVVNIASKWPANFGDGQDISKIKLLHALKNPYELATCNFEVNNISRFLQEISGLIKDGLLGNARKTAEKGYEKINLINIDSEKVYPYEACRTYFDSIDPKISRLFKNFERYKGINSVNSFKRFCSLCVPEACIGNLYTVDDIEEKFKNSIRRTNETLNISLKNTDEKTAFISVLGKMMFDYRNIAYVVNRNLEQEMNVLLDKRKKITDFKDLASINNSILELSQKMHLSKIYKDKSAKIKQLDSYMINRMDNLRTQGKVPDSHAPQSVYIRTINGDSLDKLMRQNIADHRSIYSELRAITYYKNISKKFGVVNNDVSDETLKQFAYEDPKKFLQLIERGMEPTSDRGLTVQNVLKILQYQEVDSGKTLVDCVYDKVVRLDSAAKATAQKVFANLFIYILQNEEEIIMHDENAKNTLNEFKSRVFTDLSTKVGWNIVSQARILANSFTSLELFKFIVKHKIFGLLKASEASDIQTESAVKILNSVFSENEELVDQIKSNMVNDRGGRLFMGYWSDIINKKILNGKKYNDKKELTFVGGLQEKIDVNSLIRFNKLILENGLAEQGTLTTNEYLDFFID